ncbi:MAG TPA: TetR/AcrR family transcriptional regulator C-terminal domain-containing protein [Desulfosporosinus sp.]|nr:TetR/AcrR family transcriptional regulator C-terminal domain-containing protein [Desulfosporosinus sp.]
MSHSIMTEMTKDLLADSLKNLMKIKPLHKITIQELVDACTLNRRTFYYHFKDIYDLLEWIYKKEAVVEFQKHANYNTWQESFLNLFLYIQNNKEICLCAFHSLGREHLDSFLYSVTYQLIQQVVDTKSGDRQVHEDYKKFLANFYTVAFIGLVIQWMENGMKDQPEKIIENLSITVRGSMHNALEQYEAFKKE